MSPVEREQLLATALDDYRVRQTSGDHPAPEDYADGLTREDYDEFLTMLDVEAMLDDLLEPPPEMRLPRDFGPYRLIRVLGRGAAGIVYEAENLALGRHEAVKVLQVGPEAPRGLLERFRQEAHVLARVRHPNIVEIYGAGQEEGKPYYSMGLLEGTPLSTWIRAEERPGERPDAQAICRGIAEVADALEWLHERGILHRDVKPQNIVVAPDGRMVLADFGLARSLASPRLTRTGQAPGTPLYMSPEQILGRPDEIDRRVDVYGLGATLYEALSGKPIFPHEDWRQLFRSRLNERPEPLRRVAPEVPSAAADIAMKAVELRKEDRYPTAAAMRDDLRAFVAGGRPTGRPVSPLTRGFRRVRRYALPAVAVLLAALGVALWAANRPGRLVVSATIPFEIWVNGSSRATAPAEVSLPPGEYDVELRHSRFATRSRRVSLGPGDTVDLVTIPGPAVDGNDPDTFADLSRAAGLESDSPSRTSGSRGLWDRGPPRAVFPAGPVRLADLDRYRVELGMDELPEGTRLVFRRGEEELHAEPFRSLHARPEEKPVPADLVARLAPGDFVTWGLDVPDGDDVLRTFRVVDDEEAVAAALVRVDEVASRQSPALRAALRARALLESDLPLAAFREVEAVTDASDPKAFGVAPWVQHQEALRRMGLHGDTVLWEDGELSLWNHYFPRQVVFAWYGEEQ